MIPHPAKFNDALLEKIGAITRNFNIRGRILDPFAGIGRIRELFPEAICIDIESEWARECGLQSDATRLPFARSIFDFIVTSPTYGNRMADHHKARDTSRRITYRHTIGHPLNERNTGKMQWGTRYQEMHEYSWQECARVLKLRGYFLLNIKNHIRNHEIIDVTSWHVKTIVSRGFVEVFREEVPVSGMGFGENANARIPFESLILFRLEVRA